MKNKSPLQDFAGYWYLLNVALDIYFQNVIRFHKNLIFCYKYFGYQQIVISKLYFTDIHVEIYNNHGN